METDRLAGKRLPSRRRMSNSAVWLSAPGSEIRPMVRPSSVQRGVLIGVEDLRRGLVDQLVGPVAEEALGGGVDDPDGALRVGVDHRVFGTVEDGPLQAGGFAQLAFGAGVLVDLAGEAPVGVGQGADVAAEGVVGFGEGLGFSSTWRRTASARLCTVCWMAMASRVSSSPPTSQRPEPLSSSAPAAAPGLTMTSQ
jgi:hypothetical protein